MKLEFATGTTAPSIATGLSSKELPRYQELEAFAAAAASELQIQADTRVDQLVFQGQINAILAEPEYTDSHISPVDIVGSQIDHAVIAFLVVDILMTKRSVPTV